VSSSIAGVDLLPGQDGKLYTLEVNAVPGWQALAQVTGTDIAACLLDFLQK
ncbi:MAG: 30S ribosomal protein S6--L-glutamate ligase, partial [Planctomycetaceae bacterium]|nr:30S ribosomal protein S6--L-glutamate ligase [Planctomycetaceae bacterium]